MPAGRPPIFKTAKEMQKAIDQYFTDAVFISEDGFHFERYTMSGLALALGMSRRTLVNYSHKDEFLPAIKRARQKVEESLERSLYGNGVAGVIFNLKNNFGWKDQKDVNNNMSGGLDIGQKPVEMSEDDLDAELSQD